MLFFRSTWGCLCFVWRYARMQAFLRLVQIVVNALLTPLSIIFTQRMVDAVGPVLQGTEPVGTLILWGGLLLSTMMFIANATFFDQLLLILLERALTKGLGETLVGKFRRMEYKHLEDEEVRECIEMMGQDPIQTVLGMFFGTTNALMTVFSVVGTVAVYTQIGWWFSVVFVILMAGDIALFVRGQSAVWKVYDEQSAERRRFNYIGSLFMDKHALYESRILGGVKHLHSVRENSLKIVFNEWRRSNLFAVKNRLIGGLLNMSYGVLVTVCSIAAALSGQITFGLFASISASAVTFNESISNAMFIFSDQSMITKQMSKITKLLELSETPPPEEPDETPLSDYTICFEDVCFSYPKTDRRVLDHVSFTIADGERVALVGRNGAGKSTIIKLLCRLYRPDSGRITVGGRDLNSLTDVQLRETLGVVFQDYASYTLTLRENVAFGDIRKLQDDDKLRTALKQGLAEGVGTDLDSNLGRLEEDGQDLSGGQWQRVAIARGVAGEGRFVILDEPTAALDPVAESELYDAFAAVLQSRGSIIISHRLASARMAQRILVLEGGRVVESGSHEELMAQHGLYAELFSAQSSWYTGKGEQADV